MANTTQRGIEYLQDPIRAVSIVIPCKNEEQAVRLTIENVNRALERVPVDYEIIIVDDGSTDKTRETAVAAGARVLVHNINMGYGNAVMDGIKVARYPVIAIMDADGTYPASMLPVMIDEASRHDMVIGSRSWTDENTSVWGHLFRKALYYIILYFTNKKAKDFNSGFRIFHALNILDFRPVLCPGFSFTTSLTLLYLLMAKSVSFVPIEYAKRIGKSKVSYLKDAVATFSYVFLMTNLFQAYRLSFIVIVMGLLINAIVIVLALLLSLQPALWMSLHVMISLTIIIVVVAMNTLPVAKMYLGHLQEQQINKP